MKNEDTGTGGIVEVGEGEINLEEDFSTASAETDSGRNDATKANEGLEQELSTTNSQLQTTDYRLPPTNSQLIHIRLIADVSGLSYPIDLDPTVYVKLYDRGNRTFAPDFANGNQNGNYSQTNNPGKINRGTEATQTGGTLTNSATSGFTAYDRTGDDFAGNSLSGSQDWTSASTSLRTNKVGAKAQFTTGTGSEIWAGLTYSTAGGIVKATVDKWTDYEVVNYIDTYASSTLTKQKTLIATGLRNSTHTVELELTGQKNISQSTSTASASSTTYVEDVFSTYLYTGGKTEYSLLDKNITAIGTNFSPSYPLSNINDGIAETSNWNNVAYNSDWTQFDFYLDLGTSEVIDQYSLAPQGTAPSTFYNTPTAFDVYASDDAVDWDLIHSFSWISTTYPDWEPGQYRQFIFSNTQSYQYWRFKATAEGKNSAGISLSEIHVSGSNKTINNGIDLANNGGLVWTKPRVASIGHNTLIDTARGRAYSLSSNQTVAQSTSSSTQDLISFNSDGFSLGTSYATPINNTGEKLVSWTFREAPKFFDIVTFTGSTSDVTINHNLGTVPGMIIVKKTNAANDWYVFHRSFGNPNQYYAKLNDTIATVNLGANGCYNWTATSFTLGSGYSFNNTSDSYVAYVFAHDTASSGNIQCGSYTGNGSTTWPEVALGWEPQWMMLKNASATGNWNIFDNMRGTSVGSAESVLQANLSNAESSTEYLSPTATGFQIKSTSSEVNTNSNTYIYCAIRKAPMKTPVNSSEVYGADYGDSSDLGIKTNITTDFGMLGQTDALGADKFYFGSRLTGQNYLRSNTTDAESSHANQKWDRMDGFWNNNLTSYFGW